MVSSLLSTYIFIFLILTRGYVYWFERQRKRERQILMWEPWVSCLPYTPPPGIEPTTYVYALTRNQTCNLLVSVMMLQTSDLPVQDTFYTHFNIIFTCATTNQKRIICMTFYYFYHWILVLSILKLYIYRITQYILICVWLISFRKILLKFNYVV